MNIHILKTTFTRFKSLIAQRAGSEESASHIGALALVTPESIRPQWRGHHSRGVRLVRGESVPECEVQLHTEHVNRCAAGLGVKWAWEGD